ncbi:trypsin-like peptidase domain-containing protein [Aeromicrobium sp. YIM 150415]|uniref:S1C family serine protease n=1 Tax=Aeromicrobium sp. YIM 150415 TaxID=2803912 RepID=UPI0019660647|nr:trypsin-like peptidase domain-containing protein [Aeromicrobium sp. YIM 150415]MBM9463687.1 trypsin-like peptidase domain-containing protein [Aeromicrobium sp. YIM 150415]
MNTHRSARLALAGALAALTAGVAGLTYAATADSESATVSAAQQPIVVAVPPPPSRADETTSSAADATTAQEQGLVYITTTVDYGRAEAAGTGMVLTSDGEILTNHHVVEGATSIRVQVVTTGETYSAEVVGYDATHDVAVLQLQNASGLTTADLDRSGTVAVGDEIVTVGNAHGDGGAASAASGMVTALDESITVQDEQTGSGRQLSGLIQVDADVVAGDSGGALRDADGDVIGMTTAASNGAPEVTGYAIPIEQALDIADQITSGQTSATITIGSTGFLGLQLDERGGVPIVAGTIEGSPAADLGIAQGSTITGIDGETVTTARQLSSAIAAHAAGDDVNITWLDAAGASHTATTQLTAGPID